MTLGTWLVLALVLVVGCRLLRWLLVWRQR
jgi:hypothetical protein